MSAAAALARVYAYPFTSGEAPDQAPRELPADRMAVLAFGANASRRVLARKLGPAAAAAVTVLEARVHGADVVYSAHISPYGSIPATLHPSPGAVLPARVLLLGADALAVLDATEPNYAREALGRDMRAEVPGLGLVAAEAYRSRHGELVLGGSPVALAAVDVARRALPSRAQRDVHRAVRDLLEPETDLDAFVLAGVRDEQVRARRTVRMRALRTAVR